MTCRHLALVCLLASGTIAQAAPPTPAAEDRYIAARDAAIAKISALYDKGKSEDAAPKAERAATATLTTQLSAILQEPARAGYAPAQLNLGSFLKDDEDFGKLDALRFDALAGRNGAKAGSTGTDGDYVEPKSHILVTTQSLFERWLRGHKDWWGKQTKNVPQPIDAALKDERFYTQAIGGGAAVVNFSALPIAKPAAASLAIGILAGRTQDQSLDSADEVYVSALSGGKLYIAYGSIEPAVKVPACLSVRADYNKKAEQADDDLRAKKITKKAYEALGDLRQKADDAYRRCFSENAPKQPSFAAAIKQAEALLAAAIGK